MCVSIWMYAMLGGGHQGRRQYLIPLELQAVEATMGVVKIEPESSTKAVSVLHHWALPSVPSLTVLTFKYI